MIENNGTLISHILNFDVDFTAAYNRNRAVSHGNYCHACGTTHNFGVEYSIDWDLVEEKFPAHTRDKYDDVIRLCGKCVGQKGPKTPDGKPYFTGDHLIKFRKQFVPKNARAEIKKLQDARKLENSAEGREKRAEHLWLTNDIMDAWIEGAAKHHLIKSIKDTCIRTGKVSEKQINLVKKLMEELKQPQQIWEEVPEGKIELIGKYQSVRVEPDVWNNKYVRKGLFIDDRGFKVWGSVPGMFADYDPQAVCAAKIKFVAEVKKSDKDPKFGFYKRPQQVEVILDE